MVTVSRVTALWSGFAGSPGYSRFSFQQLMDDAARNAAGAAVTTFFDAIKTLLAPGVTIQVQGQVDEFDVSTGALIGSGSMTTIPGSVSSTASALAYAGGSGLVATWNTSLVWHSHRVKGRTFLVPMAQVAYQADGTALGTAITTIQTAGNALCASTADLAVWSRWYGKPPGDTQLDGALASATSCTVKDMASQLRSRRL